MADLSEGPVGWPRNPSVLVTQAGMPAAISVIASSNRHKRSSEDESHNSSIAKTQRFRILCSYETGKKEERKQRGCSLI